MQYKDYKIDSSGDLTIQNGNFVFIYNEDVIKQQIETNLQLVAGDWFLDFTEGIGYFDKNDPLLGNSRLTVTKEIEIKAAVSRVEGVEQIIDFTYSIVANILNINITALSIFGEVESEVELSV